MTQKRHQITYSITVAGPQDDLETVAEWGLNALIDLFSQEGYTVKDHQPPFICRLPIIAGGDEAMTTVIRTSAQPMPIIPTGHPAGDVTRILPESHIPSKTPLGRGRPKAGDQ